MKYSLAYIFIRSIIEPKWLDQFLDKVLNLFAWDM